MALYLRLLGTDPTSPKIPIHAFQAIVALWAKGNMTATQARAGIAQVSGGVSLTAGEETEVQTLVATVPTGSTTANQAARALRLLHIDEVLLCVDHAVAPFDTEAGVKAALGV
jgi:hypothetical protein